MSKRTLVLGIDGGGSKTAVCIAAFENDGELRVLGEGHGGPANVRAAGREHAVINLNAAVDAAHQMAGTANETVNYAVLGLAGSGLADVRAILEAWCESRELAETVDIVHDADPVLALGTPNGIGIALIVGTGSSVIGRDVRGARAELGGWGHWFGDTGSGFDLGRRALAALAEAVDGVGGKTQLVERILKELQTDNPREILVRLGRGSSMSREIASMAPILLSAAEDGDVVARACVATAARSVARLVRAAVDKLTFEADVPLAMTGGIVSSNAMYRHMLLQMIRELGVEPDPVVVVADPVSGCLQMARERLLAASRSK